MNHEIMKEKIWDLHDPELTLQEQREIEAHLFSCADCRTALSHLENAQKALRNFKPAENPAFVYKVMDRLHENTALEQRKTSLLGWIPKWVFPAVGYSFAGILMWFAIETRQPWITTQSVLLANVPSQNYWQYSPESPEINNILPATGDPS